MGQCFSYFSSSKTSTNKNKPSKRTVVSSFTKDFYSTAEETGNVENNMSSFAMAFYGKTTTNLPPIGEDNSAHDTSLTINNQESNLLKKSLYKLSPNIMTSYTYRNLHKNVKDKLLSDTRSGVVGMKNLGNTCFMNSSLQCLSNTIPLTDYFLGFDYKSEINKTNFLGTGGKLAMAYAALMKDIWIDETGNKKKKHRVISPRSFKSILEKFAPQFEGYNQQDAQELLAYLLDGIHEDLNRVTTKPYIEDKDCDGTNDYEDSIEAWKNYLLRNKSIIVDLFQGQLRNTLQCRLCYYKSVKFEPFMYLSLPIADNNDTLYQCLQLYCKEEILQGDNVWYCPKCKTHVSASKKLDLWMLPPILIIHLKRFKVDHIQRTKLNNSIQYPVKNLDLSHMLQSSNHEKPIFDLYAISNHVGDLTSGHYTAQALNRIDNKWYDFNDSKCSLTDTNGDTTSSSSAYCLFYNRVISAKNDTIVNGTCSFAPIVRRQTICRPELWPHMQTYDDGEFRSFRRL